jgi:hypothetical protein
MEVIAALQKDNDVKSHQIMQYQSQITQLKQDFLNQRKLIIEEQEKKQQ